MWLVRNKDIVSYVKHRVTGNAVIQLTHGFSFPDPRWSRACGVVCMRQ